MTSRAAPDFDQEARKLQKRLPRFAGAALRWGIESSPFVRWPIAIVFIFAGFLGFLPILGFWMVPVGLFLLAEDIPPLRRAVRWMIVNGEIQWRRWSRRGRRAAQ